MSSASGSIASQEFSKPGVHSITFKDNFYPFASEVREELLRHPKWIPMLQGSTSGATMFHPHRQNGITTSHLLEEDRERFPQCMKFKDFIMQNIGVLFPLVGLNPADARLVEVNAMAYGAGAWLSPHTDFFGYANKQNRLIAWMLYLTAPEDGEWAADKGGAVRVWQPGGEEKRIYPRFNRFAMFRVHADSFHEIEKITWEPNWPHCRLALSGWVQGPLQDDSNRNMRLYLQTSSAEERSSQNEASLQGELALHRLLAKQIAYCGADASLELARTSELEQDYQAHREAPAGTCFIRRVAGPQGCIVVANEAGETVYFGALAGAEEKLRLGIR
ncbi:MAG: 2OG-Fe(II) oxygenase [Acidobacteriia bacterium]|nr:2OG-Fe(II) oxygenase [Terriglobia bacterium]